MTTVKYALKSTELDLEAAGITSISQLVSNRVLLGALGAPEGVTAISNGETLSNDDDPSEYEVITLEKRASSKA